MKTGRVYLTKSISLDPELADKIQVRAKELGMNFSEYISRVVQIEVMRRGEPFVIAPIQAVSQKTATKRIAK